MSSDTLWIGKDGIESIVVHTTDVAKYMCRQVTIESHGVFLHMEYTPKSLFLPMISVSHVEVKRSKEYYASMEDPDPVTLG